MLLSLYDCPWPLSINSTVTNSGTAPPTDKQIVSRHCGNNRPTFITLPADEPVAMVNDTVRVWSTREKNKIHNRRTNRRHARRTGPPRIINRKTQYAFRDTGERRPAQTTETAIAANSRTTSRSRLAGHVTSVVGPAIYY